MKPNRVIAVVLAAVAASTTAGWVAGTHISSPDDAAAKARPPTASLVTAPVESRTLSSTVTARGTVRYGEPREISLPSSTQSSGTQLVTTPPNKGATIAESDVVLQISGRPVFVLQGDIPMYRDLGPGDRGQDVLQLETALKRLGFDPGPVDGVYDDATGAAVDAWYGGHGYQAKGPTDAQRNAIRGARDGVLSAQERLANAQRALDAALHPKTTDQLSAQAEVRAAQDGVAQAQAAVADARAALANAPANAASAQAAANAQVAGAQKAYNDAQVARDAARDALVHARDNGDTLDQLQPFQDALDRAQAAVDQTHDQLVAASAAQTASAQSAARDQARLAAAVDEAVAAVRAAQDRATLAQARLDALNHPDVAALQSDLAFAERGVASAGAALADASSGVGIVVPANEVLFFSDLPLRIDDTKLERGDVVNGAVMTVSTARLAIDGALTIPDAKLVKVGSKVQVRSTDLGIEVEGTVSKVADKPGTNGVDSQRVYVEVRPEDPPAQLVGASVALTISVSSTNGAVLAVPLAALSIAADGTSHVQVVEPDGTTRSVTVNPGLSAEGYAEITPAQGESLKAGDQVVVGTNGDDNSTTTTSAP